MGIFHSVKTFFYFNALKFRCRKYPEQLRNIDVNGVNLLYAVRGPESGRPVLLLHGNGGSHHSMDTQAMELALAGYRVYSPDSRGQGANAPLEEYHYADMAEDMFRFITALGLEKPAVYGWSDGGIIALMLETAHPGTCGPSAISGANLFPDCGEGFEEFKEWILKENTPIALMMLSEPDIDPESLKAIECPYLVTLGGRDLISISHTMLIVNNIEDCELTIFSGATHGSFIKRDPRMGRRLLRFLSEHKYV